MIDINSTKYRKVHTRNIQVATYICDSDTIILEGRLTDESQMNSYRSSGAVVPPGAIHDMIVRLKVRGPQLLIEDVDVEMPTVPHDDCIQTRRCLEPVIGMEIVSGFILRVKALVGGAKGCAHLVALLTAMAPAAVQGAWFAATRNPVTQRDFSRHTFDRIKDTCYVWRSDGPALKKYEESLKPDCSK